MLFFDLLPIPLVTEQSIDGMVIVGNETSRPSETSGRTTSISRPFNRGSQNPSRSSRQSQRLSTSRGLPATTAETTEAEPLESPVIPPPPPYTPIDRNADLPPLPSEASSGRRGNRSSLQPGTPNRRASHAGSETPPPAERRRTVSSRPSNSTASTSTPLFTPSSHDNSIGNVGGFRAEMSLPFIGSGYTRVESVPTPGSQTNAYFSMPEVASPVSTNPRGPIRRASIEDPLLLLRKFDTVCIIDDSSSMEGALWLEAREALAGVADVAARYDVDGVDVHFLNSPVVGRNMRNGTEVKRLFDRVRPQGITPTGEKLESLLLDYMDRLEAAYDEYDAGDFDAKKRVKPVNFLVITDGAATDDPESVIIAIAKRLDAQRLPLTQVGIQFVQIGDDPAATEALRELDDGLAEAHGIRDIVDTVPFSAEGGQLTAEMLTKILLGGINRRHDRRKASL